MVSVSNLKKAGKVMTADHHDRELWERYFKPCNNTNLQLHVSKGLNTVTVDQ